MRLAIRELRRRLGLTQKQFGALLGMGGSTIGRWESPTDPLKPSAYHAALIDLLDLGNGSGDLASVIEKNPALALAMLLADGYSRNANIHTGEARS